MSNSLRPHGLQHARLFLVLHLAPVYVHWIGDASNHLILCCRLLLLFISFPTSGSFPMCHFFSSGGQTIGASASASVLPMSIQGWFPLGLIGLISLLSKGFSRVFSSTTIWKYQFFSFQPSLWSNFSHEISRHLLLGKTAMTNLDRVLKVIDITSPTKIWIVKAMVFPVVMYGCERVGLEL